MTGQPGYDPTQLPPDLARPQDDGAADHLAGTALPAVALASTDGGAVDLSALPGRTVVYAYPRTGQPDQAPLVPDWDDIPGARGCTPEACSFRDHHRDLVAAGADRVLGLSTQDTGYQREAVERLHLPYALLSDDDLALTHALRLPTFEAAGQVLLKRFTLVLDDGVVTHVFYPVFPPDTHADEVLRWLTSNPR
ncbi:peroxiredoxin [Angustibacter peucedani]